MLNQDSSDNVVSDQSEVAHYQRPGNVESTVSSPITEGPNYYLYGQFEKQQLHIECDQLFNSPYMQPIIT